MKKLFFVVNVVLLLTSCYEEYLLLVNNKSSYDVSFNLTTGYRTEDYFLKKGEQFSHLMIDIHSHIINSYEPKDSVFLSYDDNSYTFFDIPIPDPIPASIYNALSKDVILSGNGAISTDPLTIKANEEIITETVIKKDPVFNAKTIDGYPVQVDYIFDGTKYKIILR